MVHLTPKSLLALGVFTVAAVAALYVFALISGSGEKQQSPLPAQPALPAESAESLSEPAEQAVKQDEWLASLFCSKYKSQELPEGVVPCSEAAEFLAKNYGSGLGLSSLSLLLQTRDGRRMLFTEASQAEAERILWFATFEPALPMVHGANITTASTEGTKTVIIDARDLSVVQEKT